MITPKISRPLVAVILAEPLNGMAIEVPRPCTQCCKLRRGEVTQRQGGHRSGAGALGANRKRLTDQRGLIGGHELGAIRQSPQRHGFEAGPTKIESRPTVAVEEAVDVARGFQTRSHEFSSSRSSGSRSITTTLLPLGSISTRATAGP